MALSLLLVLAPKVDLVEVYQKVLERLLKQCNYKKKLNLEMEEESLKLKLLL